MYRLVDKPDGSFQIMDDVGENYGVFGDRLEALHAMGLLNAGKEFPEIVVHKKEGMTKTPKYTMPVLDIVQEMNENEKRRKEMTAKVLKKALTPPTKKSPIVKKRGRPTKKR